MSKQIRLLAVYAYLDDLLTAIKAMQQRNLPILAVHSPTGNQEIADLMKEKASPVRFFTLTGGILGILFGYGLAVYTAWQWKFVVSGKPPIPFAPYVIESFEFCILFAVLLNLAGLLLLARLPIRRLPTHHDPRVTEDHFSILAECPEGEAEAIGRLLKEAGAEEIHALP